MNNARRVYVYLVAFVSMAMLLRGTSRIFSDADVTDIARDAALIVVGVPIWLLHLWLAQRGARRAMAERTAALRRLYLYGVMAYCLVAMVRWLDVLLVTGFHAVLPGTIQAGNPLPLAVPSLLAPAALWAVHLAITRRDRVLVGEEGASATIRRWYVYLGAIAGLALWLAFGSQALRLAWETLARGAPAAPNYEPADRMAGYGAWLLAGAALWATHWSLAAIWPGRASAAGGTVSVAVDGVLPGSVRLQDERSTLRMVYVFVALAICVATALSGAAIALHLGLARAIGADSGGDANLALALANPISLVLVFGAGWLYHRQALRLAVRRQPETPGQAGVRRLYMHLVAVIALALVATALASLLWLAADIVTSAPHSAGWWKDGLTAGITLLAVGLPAWLVDWRPNPSGFAAIDERRARSRRVYLYLSLLGAMLTVVGAAAVVVYQAFRLALGATSGHAIVVDLGRALAVAIVAAGVALYHRQILAADAKAIRLAAPEAPNIPPPGPEPVAQQRVAPLVDDLRELVLRVPSVERAARFYIDALGLEAAEDGVGSPSQRVLRLGSRLLRLEQADGSPSPAVGLRLASPSAPDTIVARLEESGFRAEIERQGGGAWRISARDADGNTVEIVPANG